MKMYDSSYNVYLLLNNSIFLPSQEQKTVRRSARIKADTSTLKDKENKTNRKNKKQNKQKCNKKRKGKRNSKSLSFLNQSFSNDKKSGSMVECIEVFISDRKEWVHVLLNNNTIHMDLSENNLLQCNCEKNCNRMSFVIAVNTFGCVTDVTPRYVQVWSTALRNRSTIIHQYFTHFLLPEWQKEYSMIQCLKQNETLINLQLIDEKQIKNIINSEPFPSSESAFRNHPMFSLYCIAFC